MLDILKLYLLLNRYLLPYPIYIFFHHISGSYVVSCYLFKHFLNWPLVQIMTFVIFYDVLIVRVHWCWGLLADLVYFVSVETRTRCLSNVYVEDKNIASPVVGVQIAFVSNFFLVLFLYISSNNACMFFLVVHFIV